MENETLTRPSPVPSKIDGVDWSGATLFGHATEGQLTDIIWRASRGEASHFNSSTPVARALDTPMGIAALALAAAGWGLDPARLGDSSLMC